MNMYLTKKNRNFQNLHKDNNYFCLVIIIYSHTMYNVAKIVFIKYK
jgi:hypothetical protein